MNGTDAQGYIYICRTGPGPRGVPVENTFINIFFQCHGTSTNCTRHLHVCTPSSHMRYGIVIVCTKFDNKTHIHERYSIYIAAPRDPEMLWFWEHYMMPYRVADVCILCGT